jgi:ATP-dependent Clp protease ATP-binding subunit ClpB
MFLPLGRDEIQKVVKLQFNRIVERLAVQNISLEISDSAINWLASIGYDPHFGARPVKRALQQYVLNELSKQLLAGKVDAGNSIKIDTVEDELIFSNA